MEIPAKQEDIEAAQPDDLGDLVDVVNCKHVMWLLSSLLFGFIVSCIIHYADYPPLGNALLLGFFGLFLFISLYLFIASFICRIEIRERGFYIKWPFKSRVLFYTQICEIQHTLSAQYRRGPADVITLRFDSASLPIKPIALHGNVYSQLKEKVFAAARQNGFSPTMFNDHILQRLPRSF